MPFPFLKTRRRNMAKNLNVNTTATFDSRNTPDTSRMAMLFPRDARIDIEIFSVDGKGDLYLGHNGNSFILQRDKVIPNIPQTIISVLENSKVKFTTRSAWKHPPEGFDWQGRPV
jgi:hypothetical protein